MIPVVVAVAWAAAVVVALTRRKEGLRSRLTRVGVALLIGGGIAAAIGLSDRVATALGIVVLVIGVIAGLVLYRAQHVAATVVDRARLQWVAWGVVVFVAVSGAAWLLDALLGWPDDLADVALCASLP